MRGEGSVRVRFSGYWLQASGKMFKFWQIRKMIKLIKQVVAETATKTAKTAANFKLSRLNFVMNFVVNFVNREVV